MDRFDLLDNLEKIGEIDKDGMLAVVARMPEMLLDAFELAQKVSLRKIKKVRQIVLIGMGGSAIAGNIVSDILSEKIKIPIYVNRNYKLPAFVGEETLVFCLSYSGNTEETLSALKQAAEMKAKIVCITSGGKLKQIAEGSGYPLFLIPPGYQPRAALPYLLLPALKCLEQIGVFPNLKEDLEEALFVSRKLKAEYNVDKALRINPAKQLAKKLLGKIPVVFGNVGTTEAAGLRLKTQFNENSKVTALLNLFPELNHNEIVNLAAVKREEQNFCLIFLRDEKDLEKVKKRMQITKSLIGRQMGGVNEVYSQGKSSLAKILSLVLFGDFLSVYLAVLQGIDPTEVNIITRLKKELMR
ncbi:MAG: bifunctional phosphoglucose/phosphomannose isomerase [Candidatus Margulisiibacteriota bacterium]